MNPILIDFLSSLARFALAAAFGVLVKHGVIESTAVGRYVDAFSNWIVMAALAALTLGWAWVKAKGFDRALWIAIKGPDTATPSEVREQAKQEP